MKILTMLFVLLLPFAALAEGELKPLRPDNVQVIDGKKFFSLQNARRRQSTVLSPSALAVMHHPRTDPRVSQPNRLAMTPAASSSTLAAPATSAAPAATTPEKADLLSVFAPDDKAASLPSTK